jgi:quercetin dioxygenase-like cupin family protein
MPANGGFMRISVVVAIPIVTLLLVAVPRASVDRAQGGASASERVLDNPHVRAYRILGTASAGIDRGPAVLVPVGDSGSAAVGDPTWVDDAATAVSRVRGTVVVVQPLQFEAPPAASGSRPGDAPFIGMSFKPLFENDRVSVIRARMDVGAREGFHTHASDTVVVHLSGGDIEDTADGKTVVNRWKRGDVEFEGQGSSHSARNIGPAVEVVLVVLKAK